MIRKWVRKFRSIPEEKRIMWYGKLAFFKNLGYFLFKVIVAIFYQSWIIIAGAIYGVFIGFVKDNCSRGLQNNKTNLNDINSYIRGGAILAVSSLFYIAYSIVQIFIPTNNDYNMIIAIAIAAFACYSIVMSILGVVWVRGKSMLVKEYKLTNFSTAFNNVVLAQVAILSFTSKGEAFVSIANGVLGIAVGLLILGMGIYLVIDGVTKRKKYYKIIERYERIYNFKYNPKNDGDAENKKTIDEIAKENHLKRFKNTKRKKTKISPEREILDPTDLKNDPPLDKKK